MNLKRTWSKILAVIVFASINGAFAQTSENYVICRATYHKYFAELREPLENVFQLNAKPGVGGKIPLGSREVPVGVVGSDIVIPANALVYTRSTLDPAFGMTFSKPEAEKHYSFPYEVIVVIQPAFAFKETAAVEGKKINIEMYKTKKGKAVLWSSVRNVTIQENLGGSVLTMPVNNTDAIDFNCEMQGFSPR